MMMSLDGYFEGPNHDISWHHVDGEFEEFAVEQLEQTSHLLFGKTTYELMAGFWPTDQGQQADPKTAELMNTLPKTVFSKTLERVTESAYWKHVTLKHKIDVKEIEKMKEKENQDIAVLGSSNLCVSLLKLGLLDELRIMVNPVVLGKGTRLFNGLDKKIALELTNKRQFGNGNVLLYYSVVK